jgi:cytochrome P450
MTVTAPAALSLTPDETLHALFATREGQADPYPLFHHLRATAPVHRFDRDGNWYLTSFDACRALLGDLRFAKGPTLLPPRYGIPDERVEATRRRTRPSMITTNPPEHTRLRGAAKSAFMPSPMSDIRPRVAAIVEERLDVLAEGGGGEVLNDLSLPLPITVIGELLGVPVEDRDQFRGLIEQIMNVDRPDPAPDAVERAEEAFVRFREYFEDLIADRRDQRMLDLSDDLLSTLMSAERHGAMVGDEVYGTVTLIFIAGFLTTANLIANGLAALWAHPEQQDRLWRNPGLAESAVEEMLRYDTPVQMIHRIATRDIEFEGARIREGEQVFQLLGAANRDPSRFADPDTFDIGRGDNGHLAFAWGLHFCLGARLARMETELVFSGLPRRFATFEPAGDPVRAPGLFFRGYQSMPVRVTNR